MMNPLPSGSCASGARGLSGDDVAGITAIYQGIASGPNPPAAPTALTASAALSTVNLSWTPSTSGGPAQRYLVDAGNLSSGVYNLGTSVLNSAATSATFGGVPAGTYFVRVRAQNAVGTSGPSPEAQVSVGACAAPGPPGPLSFAANDTTVNLQWSAPAGRRDPGLPLHRRQRARPGQHPGAGLSRQRHRDRRHRRALRHLLRARGGDQRLRRQPDQQRGRGGGPAVQRCHRRRRAA